MRPSRPVYVDRLPEYGILIAQNLIYQGVDVLYSASVASILGPPFLHGYTARSDRTAMFECTTNCGVPEFGGGRPLITRELLFPPRKKAKV
jgi:hypothetical protein